MSIMSEKLTEKQRAYHLLKMHTRFIRLDVNKDGFISWEDFESMAGKLIEYSKTGKEHAESTRKAFMTVAENVGLKQGVKTTVEEAARKASIEMLSMTPEKQWAVLHSGHDVLFDAIDQDKNGYISLEEFKVYFQVIGPDISEAEMRHSFDTIDADKNGKISRDEFLNAAFDFMFGVEETEVSKVFFGHLLQ
jgi:Ca2+-binding EF-hand superfamily protein